MINILITFLVVAIVIGFLHILSMCKMAKDTDRRNKEIKQNQLKNKRMANAEPGNYRCCICGKKFTDGGTFKAYKNEWHCINCYLEERKKQAESVKAGEK